MYAKFTVVLHIVIDAAITARKVANSAETLEQKLRIYQPELKVINMKIHMP